MPPDVDVDVVAQLRPVLLQLARRVHRQADAGISPSRMSALLTIERHGPLRLGELGTRERISKSSVTRIVAHLEEADYITRIDDPTDGRSSLVTVTAAGRDFLAAFGQRAEAYLTRQMAALEPADRDALAAILPVLERLLKVKA